MKFLILLVFLVITPALAIEIDTHYFGSLNMGRTTIDDSTVDFEGYTNRWGMAAITTAGLNLSTVIDERSSALLQLIHQRESDDIRIDLLQYKVNLPGNYVVRVGKQRLPTFLYSEVIQVEALLPWATLPFEVYSKVFLRSFSGVNAEKKINNFGLQLFSGDNRDFNQVDGQTEAQIRSYGFFGGRADVKVGKFEAFFNYLHGNANATITTVTTSTEVSYKDLTTLTGGLKYTPGKFLLLSEFFDSEGPQSLYEKTQSGYASLGYNFRDDLLVVGTFSGDIYTRSIYFPSQQNSYSLSVSHNLNMNVVVKAGASYVDFKRRTAPGVFPGLINDSTFGYNKSPDQNYMLYNLQLAMVF